MPRSAKGVISAERVPMTIPAALSLALSHAFNLSLSFKPEWITATGRLKRFLNRLIVCGVKPISGTKTKACLACSSTGFIRLR